jgi:phenylpropionate dioxygenase-like ring-hydroxylating dioxygenase large terminal subunit
MFIKNTWYVAGWSKEVPQDGFLARTILGLPLALWRDQSGKVVAFEDMCCHRGAPLSRGRREGAVAGHRPGQCLRAHLSSG